jgi:uncharacterized membrane protein YgcG
MSSRWEDPNWWPTPIPPKPPSTAKVVIGILVPVVAVAAAVLAILVLQHSGGKPIAAKAAAPAGALASSSRVDRRAAFDQCMKSMGAGSGSGFRGGGRFGGGRGPSQSFRNALAVCRSLLQTGGLSPQPLPTTTATPAAPVA